MLIAPEGVDTETQATEIEPRGQWLTDTPGEEVDRESEPRSDADAAATGPPPTRPTRAPREAWLLPPPAPSPMPPSEAALPPLHHAIQRRATLVPPAHRLASEKPRASRSEPDVMETRPPEHRLLPPARGGPPGSTPTERPPDTNTVAAATPKRAAHQSSQRSRSRGGRADILSTGPGYVPAQIRLDEEPGYYPTDA